MIQKIAATLCLLFLFCGNNFSQENFKITHGPYLQELSDTAVTIVYTTNRNGISWVEMAPDDTTHFYLTERPRYYSTNHGIKNVSSVHQVRIQNLVPGTRYRYRVFAKEVLNHQGFKVQYGNTVATNVYSKKPLVFKTPKTGENSLSFLMINDIHGKNDIMESLLKQTDMSKTNLVFFNGDMASDLQSEEQMFTDFMDTGVKLFASEVPMYYARGNHETRGQFAVEFPRYFPNSNGKLYYMFQQGTVCFIVLDCGEDKPDSDMEYSDITDFDKYRTEQAEWLKSALQSKQFLNASYRIVIVHMPPFGGWHGELEITQKFVPLLNKAGVDVMFCGHLHEYIHQQPNSAIKFPVIANSNNTLLKGDVNGKQMVVKILDSKGGVVDSFSIPSRK